MILSAGAEERLCQDETRAFRLWAQISNSWFMIWFFIVSMRPYMSACILEYFSAFASWAGSSWGSHPDGIGSLQLVEHIAERRCKQRQSECRFLWVSCSKVVKHGKVVSFFLLIRVWFVLDLHFSFVLIHALWLSSSPIGNWMAIENPENAPWVVFWQTPAKQMIPASLGVATRTLPFGCSQVRVFALSIYSFKACKSYFSFICSPHGLIRDSDDSDAPSPINASLHHLFFAHPSLQNLTNESFVEISGPLKRCAFSQGFKLLGNWCTSVGLDGCTQLGNLPSLAKHCSDDNFMLFRLIVVTSFALLCCVTMCDLFLAKLKQTLAGLCVATRREVCPSLCVTHFLHSFIYALTAR